MARAHIPTGQASAVRLRLRLRVWPSAALPVPLTALPFPLTAQSSAANGTMNINETGQLFRGRVGIRGRLR